MKTMRKFHIPEMLLIKSSFSYSEALIGMTKFEIKALLFAASTLNIAFATSP